MDSGSVSKATGVVRPTGYPSVVTGMKGVLGLGDLVPRDITVSPDIDIYMEHILINI